MKRTLHLAIVAVIAAGCSSEQTAVQPAETTSVAGPPVNIGPPQPTDVQGPGGQAGVTDSGATGSTGSEGVAGPMGPRGAVGATGASGATAPSGPVGARGPAGKTGARGPTPAGPAAPVGGQGPVAAQGASGTTGAMGSSMQSSSSASDASGNAGAQGAVEQIDSHVPGATVDHWAPYRSFVFDDGRAVIRAADERQITDTAAYLARNPSLRLGINDSMDVENTSASEQRLGERRVAAVRDALIRAGTPADRIETGAFGDPKRRRNQRVGVFLLTPQ